MMKDQKTFFSFKPPVVCLDWSDNVSRSFPEGLNLPLFRV